MRCCFNFSLATNVCKKIVRSWLFRVADVNIPYSYMRTLSFRVASIFFHFHFQTNLVSLGSQFCQCTRDSFLWRISNSSSRQQQQQQSILFVLFQRGRRKTTFESCEIFTVCKQGHYKARFIMSLV